MALYGKLSLEDDIIQEILSSLIPRNPIETKTSHWLLYTYSHPASEHSREELSGSNPEA